LCTCFPSGRNKQTHIWYYFVKRRVNHEKPQFIAENKEIITKNYRVIIINRQFIVITYRFILINRKIIVITNQVVLIIL